MLRIKKNVNLKRLEEFGFRNSLGDTYYADEENSRTDFETGIIVNPLGSRIKNEIVYYTNSTKDNIKLNEDELDMISSLDVLYDLINAGLVEKVDEHNGKR